MNFNFGFRRIKPVHETRYLSLPKDWLRFWGLDAEDRLLVEVTVEGYLLLKPEKEVGRSPQLPTGEAYPSSDKEVPP